MNGLRHFGPRFLLVLFGVALGACTQLPVAPEGLNGPSATKSPGKPVAPSTSENTVAGADLEYYLYLDQKARLDNATAAHITAYLQEGFALSDRLCLDWFTLLERRRRAAEFGQGSFAIGGATSGTLLGLASAAAKEIGAVAAVFGGIDSLYNLSKTTFFLTPKLGVLRDKVMALRATMVTTALGEPSVTSSHGGAYQFLVKYGGTCSLLELQRFVDSATDLAKYEFKPAALEENNKTIAANKIIADLLTTIGWPTPLQEVPKETLRQYFVSVYVEGAAEALKYGPLAQELAKSHQALAAGSPNREKADRLLAALGGIFGFEKNLEQLAPLAQQLASAQGAAAPGILGAKSPDEQSALKKAVTDKVTEMTVVDRTLRDRAPAGVPEIHVVPDR